MNKLQFLADAASELEDARQYYESCRHGLGGEMLDEVDAALVLISRAPQRYPRYRNTQVRLCLLRRFPYGLYYLPTQTLVWIIAVGHHRRRPGYWKKRLAAE